MKSLGLHRLCRKAVGVLLYQEIHTGCGLLARGRGKAPRILDHEPGTKFRNLILEGDKHSPELPEDFEEEGDYDDDFDFMKVGQAYDEHERDVKKNKQKLETIITRKRFFAPRPQPPMLTYQERECIRYLHKQDPVQWDVRTLSESFPATPEVISKILRSKWKITPERAKIINSRVQQNWNLLAEGKLDADPEVLNHFKKFVNRREVLLEQIKNEDFYLPEVKREPCWNQGEFNNLLENYEKQIKKLQQTVESQQKTKLLGDGEPEKESAVDFLHKKVTKIGATKQYEKDSFMVGGVVNAYGKEMTYDEVVNKVLQRRESGKRLNVFDKAILESKLGKSRESFKELPKNSAREERVTVSLKDEDASHSVKQRGRVKNKFDRYMKSDRQEWAEKNTERYRNEEEMLKGDENTQILFEADVGKVLNKEHNPPEPKEEQKKEKKVKPENLDPESIALENAFYDREVKHIQNTSFWNDKRSSKEKALTETEKLQNDVLAHNSDVANEANYPVFSMEAYPERIKIPKGSRGSGLTFRVKDCYYDDDGMFLYKVPGMSKC